MSPLRGFYADFENPTPPLKRWALIWRRSAPREQCLVIGDSSVNRTPLLTNVISAGRGRPAAADEDVRTPHRDSALSTCSNTPAAVRPLTGASAGSEVVGSLT